MSTSEREDLQTEVWKPRQLTGGLAQEMSWLGCARTFGCFSISSHFPQMLCCKFNSRRAMGLDFHGHQTAGRFFIFFFSSVFSLLSSQHLESVIYSTFSLPFTLYSRPGELALSQRKKSTLMCNIAWRQCFHRNLRRPWAGNWQHLFMASSRSGSNPNATHSEESQQHVRKQPPRLIETGFFHKSR